ncbi:hypothetical protein [Jidongwangia harbinensis]|uniref:hypothetical protein n=1 Tax=Jidongwangia harbinensis TaxID=2878561 RepID=UPI001CD95D80|nr:hypothetical protein [Jidongwangia harbinensis]MCA2213605.1 hypothetical protein [Jidongwangia harbinensis]
MRRAFLALALGGALLTASACSDDPEATDAAPAWTTPSAEATSPAPDYSANTKVVCGKVNKIFAQDIKAFGTQMGKMIAYKEAKEGAEADKAEKAAGTQLKNIGTKVRKETAAAQDPDLKTAGASSAAKLTKSAADRKFFDSIKTQKDLDRTIENRMAEWLTPVAGYCA